MATGAKPALSAASRRDVESALRPFKPLVRAPGLSES